MASEQDEILQQTVDAINARPWLEEIVQRFLMGLNAAGATLVLPEALLHVGVEGQMTAAASFVKRVVLGTVSLPEALKATALARINEAFSKATNSGETKAAVEAHTAILAARLESDPNLKEALMHTRQAAVVRAWAALESLAGDAWEASLNNATEGTRLAMVERATRQSTQAGGLGQKEFTMQLFAEHGFDFRMKMGTILKGRFDFTGVVGIRAAYSAAFGRFGPPVPAFRDVPRLKEIEATRHVIAHSGGLVDRQFLGKVKRQDAKAGDLLELTGAEVVDMINDIRTEAVALLSGLTACLLAAEAK